MAKKAQSHEEFKVFIAKPDAQGFITPAMQKQVRKFAEKYAVKSVGVEYLEGQGDLVLSLGYRSDQPGYPVELHYVSLGKPTTAAAIGKAMGKAASAVKGNVICHEFYVTDTAEYVLVLLVHS